MAKKKTKLRYGVMYFRSTGIRDFTNPDTWGSTALLENAMGKAAQHVARSKKLKAEYGLAVIYDRWFGRLVMSYKLNANEITIKEY